MVRVCVHLYIHISFIISVITAIRIIGIDICNDSNFQMGVVVLLCCRLQWRLMGQLIHVNVWTFAWGWNTEVMTHVMVQYSTVNLRWRLTSAQERVG